MDLVLLLILFCNFSVFFVSAEEKKGVMKEERRVVNGINKKETGGGLKYVVGTDKKEEEEEGEKEVLKYSKKPSFLCVGFDFFNLVFGFFAAGGGVEGGDSNKRKSFTNIDTRWSLGFDINKILINSQFGFFYRKSVFDYNGYDKENCSHQIFVNPCVCVNVIRKNSDRDTVYIGGGVSFNFGNSKIEDKGSLGPVFQKYGRLWFNIVLGGKKSISSFFHIGTLLSFNFFCNNFFTFRSREESTMISDYVFGYGFKKNPFTVGFSFFAFLNFNLHDDEKVFAKESSY